MTSPIKPPQRTPELRPVTPGERNSVATPVVPAAHPQDSFSALRRASTATDRAGYGHPVDASELPDPGNGTAVMTLNIANGAGEKYRTAANRAAQAALIREAGASVVGFQEVDVGVQRTGNVNTALEIARLVNPAFDAFANGGPVARGDWAQRPAGTGVLSGADGTTVFQTAQGSLITGESFSGDDRGSGVAGDKGADAIYGNAIYVGAPNRVVEAYTVSLPHSAGVNDPPPLSRAELRTLAAGPLSPETRSALGERNEAIRHRSGIEPRSALVARVEGPDGVQRTIINLHLSVGRDHEALRQKQLAFVSELIRAEREADPPREVLLMGDFNDDVADVAKGLAPAGMQRVVGGRKDSFANIDQVWVSPGMVTDTSAQVKTRGVSDHPHAGYTVLR